MVLDIIELLKVIVLGIVEGITEWLPVSSTGHMYLLDEFWGMNVSAEFREVFMVVIQLGAILAVLVLFWSKIFPFGLEKKEDENGAMKRVVKAKKDVLSLWLKVIVACLPAAVIGFLLDDILDEYLYNGITIAVTLIVYGVAFILVENRNKGRIPRMETTADIDYKTALLIGAFQVLALVPGTSRSGATVIGALLIGVSRPAAAEFTFILAIPV
ncbi:MAG: undecaprenyl-diphosphate phosphatase, partial [Clostridia bacterium]|nr:undecaprenyl-diphosphate phosphatase [Clostridia bacterium]